MERYVAVETLAGGKAAKSDCISRPLLQPPLLFSNYNTSGTSISKYIHSDFACKVECSNEIPSIGDNIIDSTSRSIITSSTEDNIDMTFIDDAHHDDADDTMNLSIAAAAAFLVSDNGSLLRGGESPRDSQRFLFPESGLDRHLAGEGNMASSMISLCTDSNNSISNSSCCGNTTTAAGRGNIGKLIHHIRTESIDDGTFDIFSTSQHPALVVSEADDLVKCDEDEFLFTDSIFNDDDNNTDGDDVASTMMMRTTTTTTMGTSSVSTNLLNEGGVAFGTDIPVAAELDDDILLQTSLTLMTRELAETMKANERKKIDNVPSHLSSKTDNSRRRPMFVDDQIDEKISGSASFSPQHKVQSKSSALENYTSVQTETDEDHEQEGDQTQHGTIESNLPKMEKLENVANTQYDQKPANQRRSSLEPCSVYDELFLSHRKDLVCLICGKGEIDDTDGSIRPIVRFLPSDLDVVPASVAPTVTTFGQDVCLHVFCGKTASILPHINRPDLEILSKAGLKNKHGIGQEVNSALARTRCAVIAHEIITACTKKGIHINTKEKHFYLVREFEAHLAAIRQLNMSYNSIGNGFISNNSIPSFPISASNLTTASASASGLEQVVTQSAQHESCNSQIIPTSTPICQEITVEGNGRDKKRNSSLVTNDELGRVRRRTINSARVEAVNSDDESDNSSSIRVMDYTTQDSTTVGKKLCPCGGYFQSTDDPNIPTNYKINKSWRNHVTTKRHQKWMAEHAV